MKSIDRNYLNEFYDRAIKIAGDDPINIYGAGEASHYVLELNDNRHLINVYGDPNQGCYGDISIMDLAQLPSDSSLYICSRWNNISVIYNRISEFCNSKNIKIYDLNGNQICGEKRNVCSDPYEAGKRMVEPILANLLFWMIRKGNENLLSSVLLGSRDGWILSRMYDAITSKDEGIPIFKYIYISRVLSTKCGITNEEDFRFACNRRYDGDKKSMLMSRFGLKEEDISCPIDDSTREWYKTYYDKVSGISSINRREYLQYMSGEISSFQNAGYFDFVSTGTCQFWLEKILEHELTGLYFLAKQVKGREKMKMISVGDDFSCYCPLNYYIDSSYVLLEKIMTSEEPPVTGIEKGEFIFDSEVRSEKDISIMREIHDGIIDAFLYRLSRMSHALFDGSELEESVYNFYCTKYTFWDKEDLILKDDYCNFKVDLSI